MEDLHGNLHRAERNRAQANQRRRRIRQFFVFELGLWDDCNRDWNSHSNYHGLVGQPVRDVHVLLNLKLTILSDSGALMCAAVRDCPANGMTLTRDTPAAAA